MQLEPVAGKPLRFPPGHVAIRLDERHRSAYRRLYARYRTIIDGLPVLRDRDFDGRALKVTKAQLEALNRAFATIDAGAPKQTGSVFEAQEAGRTGLFKRLQYLS
jgi:hypothetical protein